MLRIINNALSRSRLLVYVFIFAFVMRIVGITHGFPFIFHPDEPALVRSAVGLRFFWNPGHFDWPHLHFYLNYFLHLVFIKSRGALQILQLRGILSALFPILWRDPLIFYLLSRLFDALLGALTVVPVYLAGKTMFNKRVGLYSALALALIPFHVHASHFALIDVPMVFWLSWVVYFASKIFQEKGIRNYVLAGVFVGFAASTKYHGALSAIMVFLAHVFRTTKRNDERFFSLESLKELFVSGSFSIASFIVGTPYSLLDMGTFLITDSPKGAMWQFTNVGGVGFLVHIKQLVDVFTVKLIDDFGYTFLIIYVGMFLCLIVVRSVRVNKKLWFLFISSLFFFYYLAGFEKIRSHYFIPTYPFVALVVGYFFDAVFKKVSEKKAKILFLLIFGFPFMFSVYRDILLLRKDTRKILYEWMLVSVKQEDQLVYESDSLIPVMEKFSKNDLVRWEGTFENISVGYAFLSFDDQEYLAFITSNDFIVERVIKSNMRRGPNIVILEAGTNLDWK